MTDRQICFAMLAAVYGGPGMAALMMGHWDVGLIGVAVGSIVVWIGEIT